jgi:Na+-transporting NADH:ubiquinone oxidoreductase subunit NqrC
MQRSLMNQDNRSMLIFYWVMVVLIVGTLVPSVFFLLLYAVQGDHNHADRARSLWNFSRLFAMLGVNLLIWGHVAVGLWQIWFR